MRYCRGCCRARRTKIKRSTWRKTRKKGVIVRVGTDVYEGVNAVPEGEIKKMLQDGSGGMGKPPGSKPRADKPVKRHVAG